MPSSGTTLKLLTLAPGKAWRGESRGSVLNRKGCDALAPSHVVCFWTVAFIFHTVPQLRSHLSVPYLKEVRDCRLQCLGVFLPSSLTSERATPSSFFLQLCPSWNLQAPRPTGPCKNESRLPSSRDLKCTGVFRCPGQAVYLMSSATVPTLGRTPRGVANVS